MNLIQLLQWMINNLVTDPKRHKTNTVKDRKQLINEFSKIFSKEFIEYIKKWCPYDIFCNSHGINSGLFWFTDRPGPVKGKVSFLIFRA